MRVRRSGLSQIIADALRQDIISGKLLPGSPLLQDKIAKQFDASHVPVREALQSLQAEGLVSYFPRKGASISPISVEDIREIIEMRIVLEKLALQNAIESEIDIDFDQAIELHKISDTSQNIEIWVSSNWNFHRLLYKQCKNTRLLSTIEELWVHSERYLRAVWKTLDYQSKSQMEHAEVLLKLQQKDATAALDLLERHIKEAGNSLINVIA